jgi:hypothetical protein
MPFAQVKTRSATAADSKSYEFLIPSESYLQAVRKTLGIIDLDPCSTPAAQQLIEANGWFQLDDAAASLAVPWSGKVFLHPHRSPRLSRLQLHKLLRDYIADRVPEAIILISRTDWLRAEPLLLSFPFLFHYKRLRYWRENKDAEKPGAKQLQMVQPSNGSATLYLPAKDGAYFCQQKMAQFSAAFSPLGRIVLNEDQGDRWQQDASLAMARSHAQPFLTHPGIERHGK